MRKLDLIGKRFGKQIVLRRDGISKDGHTAWLVKCDCGNIHTATGNDLVRKLLPVRSCRKCFQTTHGYSERGEWHYLYKTWCAIKDRCFRKTDKSFKNYGGRGITICHKWKHSFNEFRNYIEKTLGKRPIKYSLDRINNDGNYEPGNVRWATAITQARNKRK